MYDLLKPILALMLIYAIPFTCIRLASLYTSSIQVHVQMLYKECKYMKSTRRKLPLTAFPGREYWLVSNWRILNRNVSGVVEQIA